MIIYKATNLINNKIYIGKTVLSLEQRIKNHLKKSKTNKRIYFHKAIHKYGIENFKWEIIYNSSSLKDLNEKEIYYINYYRKNKNNKIYNITNGGSGGDTLSNHPNKKNICKKIGKSQRGKPKPPFTEEHKKNIGNAHRGKFVGKEARKHLSIACKGKKNGMYGKHHSEETKRKISEKRKGIFPSTEIRKKLSIACRGKKNGMYGKHHSLKSRRLMGKRRKEELNKRKGIINGL